LLQYLYLVPNTTVPAAALSSSPSPVDLSVQRYSSIMSREAPPETINVGHLTEQRVHISMLSATLLYHYQFPPSIAGLRDVDPNQSSQTRRETNFSDGSGPLFNMYLKMTEEEDKKMAHRWQKDADGILIFVSSILVPTLGCSSPGQHKNHRPVYSLLPSQHWSRSLFKT
jgi:hypothetical protein